jgi:hypothetical protein
VVEKSFPGLPRCEPIERFERYVDVDEGNSRSRPELTPLSYCRLPLGVALAEMPAHWTGLELRLLIFLIAYWDLNRPHGISSIPIREAKRFLGAQRAQIEAAANNLVADVIITREVDDMLLVLFTPGLVGPRGRKYRGELTPQGVWQESFPLLSSVLFQGESLSWDFTGTFISKLADPGRLGYGKVHFEAVHRIRSLDALRLYIVGCITVGCGLKEKDRLWQPASLARFLGYANGIRMDNIKRSVRRAIGEIKRAGAFDDDLTKAHYDREPSGRGHRIAAVRFTWFGDGSVVHPALSVDAAAAAERARADEHQEFIDRDLAERLQFEREMKRLGAREAWEAKKAAIVGMSDQELEEAL